MGQTPFETRGIASMKNTIQHEDRYANVEVDLKNPAIAALLAWLWPGAGHLYQRRTAKGLLFMICILVTYFWGLAMGRGHVVYASFTRPDVRYPFFLQIGVGLPAFPAIAQRVAADGGRRIFNSSFMAPPRPPLHEQQHDELAVWHQQLGFYFELGTLYTMIAGLLNFLVIYDAFAGPVFSDPQGATHKSHEEHAPNEPRANASTAPIKPDQAITSVGEAPQKDTQAT